MAVVGYEIELEGVVTDVGNVLTYEFTGLPETPHDARIRSYDDEGNRGPWSAIITDTPLPPPINVALDSNGATASATSEAGGFEAQYANNGFRHTENSWNPTGGWSAAGGQTTGTLTIDFGVSRTISEIDVYTLADTLNYNTDPTLTDTFTLYGIVAFTVEYWNGSTWAVVTGGTVTGNDKVWRQFTFTALSTDKIRVAVTSALAGEPRIVEVEAWGS